MMKAKQARIKGQKGEREVVALLQPVVDKVFGFNEMGHSIHKLERNLDQTRDGGHDIDGLDGFSIEVKWCEQFQINKWWKQTLDQALGNKENIRYPILFYRKSHNPWRMKTFVTLQSGDWAVKHDTFVATFEVDEALKYFEWLLRNRVDINEKASEE